MKMFSGQQKFNIYNITTTLNEAVQHVEYVPFGEVFIEERNNKWNTPYLFNAKELDEETGLYYYGARYYEPRVSLWLNADPSQEKYPGISTYAYCHNSLIILKDPDGKNPILGALTEYAGIIGSKMLFEGQSFVDANKSLTWGDGVQIAISAATGAATGAIDGGISKFAKWVSNSRNQKIIIKLLEVGVDALENVLKDFADDRDINIKGLLVSTLTDIGLGHLLQTDKLGKIADEFSDNAKVATKKAEDLSKRTNPNEKLIKKAQDNAKSEQGGFVLFKGLETATDATTNVISEGLENKVKKNGNEQKK